MKTDWLSVAAGLVRGEVLRVSALVSVLLELRQR